MARLQDEYDWLVLGDHPGALLSACLASKLGFSVLVLPIYPSLLKMVSKSGQCLDPEPNFIMGMGKVDRSHGLLADCLALLGVKVDHWDEINRDPSILPQVLTPDFRLAFRAGHEEFTQECIRELGPGPARKFSLASAIHAAEPLVNQFWKQFPMQRVQNLQSVNRYQSFFERHVRQAQQGSVARTLDQSRAFLSARFSTQDQRIQDRAREWIQASRSLRDTVSKLGGEKSWLPALEGLYYGVVQAENSSLHSLDFVQLMALARSGLGFKGGLTPYRSFLLRLARQMGVQVPLDLECRRLFIEGGKLIGAQIAHRGKLISVRAGIMGCSMDHLKEYFSFSGRTPHYRLKQTPKPDGWRFTLALSVHSEAIPPGMNSRMVWKEEGAPALEIEMADPNDYNMGHLRDHRLIFLRTTLPFTQESLNVDYQRTVAGRMFRQLSEIIPFLEFHVTKVYPDFRVSSQAQREEFSESFGFVSPELIPDNIRSFSGGGLGSTTGIEGLYVASGESYPELGSMGGTVAALEAVIDFAQKFRLTGQKRIQELWSGLEA